MFPTRSGYLEKYSTGRASSSSSSLLLPSFLKQNWQRRWISVSSEGLSYYKCEEDERRGKEPLGAIPFRRRTLHGFVLDPCLLYNHVGVDIHPAAVPDAKLKYFAVQFIHCTKKLLLLFRTSDDAEYRGWREHLSLILKEGGASDLNSSFTSQLTLTNSLSCIGTATATVNPDSPSLHHNTSASNILNSSSNGNHHHHPHYHHQSVDTKVMDWDDGMMTRRSSVLGGGGIEDDDDNGVTGELVEDELYQGVLDDEVLQSVSCVAGTTLLDATMSLSAGLK
eukprot:PhF_6_TR29082/c0_g1_i1/m.42395